MAEFRIQRRKNKAFAIINNEPLKNNNLSLRAKGFLSMIMTLPDTWDFSIKGIVSCIKESEGVVRLIIAELKEAGYCKCEREYVNGRVSKFRYIFTDESGIFDDNEQSTFGNTTFRKTTCGKTQSSINNKENKYNNKENNKEKTLLTESEKGAGAPSLSELFKTDGEKAFDKGMKEKYPYVAKMDVPLTYADYIRLQSKYSRIKIHMNLRAMNDWKGLSKRRSAILTLENWCNRDKNEYKESDLL